MNAIKLGCLLSLFAFTVACSGSPLDGTTADPSAEPTTEEGEEAPAEEEEEEASPDAGAPKRDAGSTKPDSGAPKADSGSTAPTVTHPSWLVNRSYTKGYKLENNVYFESDDRGIRFGGSPSYNYEEKLGKTWSVAGTWGVTGNTLTLTPKYNAPRSFTLTGAFTANCRVISMPGMPRMFTYGMVSGCGVRQPLTTEECNKAGTYTKTDSGGSSSSSYEYSTEYKLEPDGFFSYTTSSFRMTCYGDTCKSLSNRSAPIVGRFWVQNGQIMTDALSSVNVAGFAFTRATAACVR